MYDLIPLHLLSCGQAARIQQLMGCPEQIRRLEELGLCHGTTIEMVQPGSPCIVRLAGGKLCLRQNDALSVLVGAGEGG